MPKYVAMGIYLYAQVTGPGLRKQVLSTKILVHIMAPMYCPVYSYYPKSVSFIEFLMNFCIYDDILNTMQITDKSYYILNSQNEVKILCVDKTGFPRHGHKQCY